MNLCFTLAEAPGTGPVEGDLDSLHRWLTGDAELFSAVQLEHRPGARNTMSVSHELIAPLAELDWHGLQALPLAIALWIQQQRSDLHVSYRCPDGTEMVVKVSRTRNPEQVLRQVIEAANRTEP